MSFTLKALAAASAAFGLDWHNIMIVLYEVMLWFHYGYIMVVLWLPLQLLHQPGERLCCGCRASQENKQVCSPYGSSILLPAS